MFNKKYIHISKSHTIHIFHAIYHTIIQYTLNTGHKSGWCYMLTDRSYKNRCLIFSKIFNKLQEHFKKKIVFWNFLEVLRVIRSTYAFPSKILYFRFFSLKSVFYVSIFSYEIKTCFLVLLLYLIKLKNTVYIRTFN